MADAVLWQILDTVQDRLQALSFVAMGTDSVETIATDAIVIRKIRSRQTYQRDDEEFESEELTPGIIITPPSRVIRPKEGGTNLRDDVYYNVMCQIIDGDGFHNEQNLRSYVKWQEQIAKHFNAKPLPEVQGSEGCVNIVYASETDVVDETLFVRHDKFVAGVLLEFLTREDRV